MAPHQRRHRATDEYGFPKSDMRHVTGVASG